MLLSVVCLPATMFIVQPSEGSIAALFPHYYDLFPVVYTPYVWSVVEGFYDSSEPLSLAAVAAGACTSTTYVPAVIQASAHARTY